MAARKRAAALLTPEPSGRRRSTRISSSGQKSKYFEGDDSDIDFESDTDIRHSKRAKKSASARNGSRRKLDEDEDGDSDQDAYKEDEDEDEDDDDDEEEEADSGKDNGTGNDGDYGEDDEDDEDAPAKVTFIPHKKLRDLGGIDYTDGKVHPVTMSFLKDLKANNRRTWLKENDAEFRRSQKDWESYIVSLTERIIAEADDTIPELPPKDIIFRVYRDIRFSKDQRPYKPHYSAAWSRTGKKGPYACYYVHCEPGSCFVGGGIWHPDNDALRLLRASIDERPQRWRRVLVHNENFRCTFFPATKKGDEKAVLKAFAKVNAEGALKKKPLGYIADHRDIELLKLRNFTISKKVPDSMFTDPDGQDKLVEVLQAIAPFVAHLNRVVRPDPGDEDDSEEEGDREEAEEEEEEEEED